MNEMEVKTSEVVEEAIEVAQTSSKGAKVAKAAGVMLVLGTITAGVAVLAKKYKAKHTALMIKRLEKEGYIVTEKIFDDHDEENEVEE